MCPASGDVLRDRYHHGRALRLQEEGYQKLDEVTNTSHYIHGYTVHYPRYTTHDTQHTVHST